MNPPRAEPFVSSLETPKSAMKPKKSDDQIADAEKTSANNDGESNEIKINRKENQKIKFVQCTVAVDEEQNYHTPISFKMNKFMMCFKSEPDLSRVQNINDNAPTLNRGRFIAKKLLSGVSMINLRRPTANSSEKPENPNEIATNQETNTESMKNAPDPHEASQHDTETCTVSSIAISAITTEDDKIDDDDEDFVDDEEVDREYDDSVDKENRSPHQCKPTDFISKLVPIAAVNCALSDSIAMANDSVSPITISTHRMSKAMQVNKLLNNQEYIIEIKMFDCFFFF